MGEQNTTASPVFVSYSHSDAAFASEVVISLQCCGFAPRIDQHDLPPGEEWQNELYKMIARASSTVFVLSVASLASKECRKELDYALERGKRVIPLVIDEAAEATAPEALKRVQFIRFVGRGRTFAMGIADLVKALRTDIAWVDDHTLYTDRAARWIKGQKPTSQLLPEDALAHAVAWLGNPPSAGMKVTTDVTDYISASKQHIEETERKRIEARALQQITEQKARDKRRIATVATAAAFVVVIVGSAAVLLVQNADAATKSAEFEQRLANVVAQDCASSPQSAEVSDRDVAQGLLQDHIKELLSEDRTARHNARDAIAELLDGRNSAALNRGFFDLMTERARIQPQNRYRLLLGMAETFGAMRGPIAMQDPAKVIKLLRELQIAINDPTFKKSFDNAIAALSASSSR